MGLHFIHFYKESKDYPIAVVSSENWLTGKDPDSGKDWRQEKKDELVGWHHWLNGQSLSKLQELVRDREAGVLQSMGS